MNKKAASLSGTPIRLQWQPKVELFVQPAQVSGVADEQVTHVIGRRFGSECLERDFGADSGDVTERKAYPASHGRGGLRKQGVERR